MGNSNNPDEHDSLVIQEIFRTDGKKSLKLSIKVLMKHEGAFIMEMKSDEALTFTFFANFC